MSTTCLLGILSALIWVRVGSLQLEDILLLVLLAYCSSKFLYSAFSIRVPLELHSLFQSYNLLLPSLLVMSILSLRLPFYPLDRPTFLEKPLLFSLARLLQLVSVVYGFLWLTSCLSRKQNLLVPAMSAYWITGVVSSGYAIGCYIAAAFFHVTLSSDSIWGVFQPPGQIRARGFFNEGGPFGVYLVTVILIGLLRRHVTGRKLGLLGTAIVVTGFVLSRSITGVIIMVLLFAFHSLTGSTVRQRLTYGLFATVVIVGVGALLNPVGVIEGYIEGFQSVELQVDPALASGRIGAYYIVPRMIAAHPLTGIGIGNYPFMRNDPHYLGPLPPITYDKDLAAFGVPGLAAEVGIPITVWIMILTFTPYWKLRKSRSLIPIVAVFQPVAHALGVQLTFFYPWFVSACALAAASYREPQTPERLQVAPRSLDDRRAIIAALPTQPRGLALGTTSSSPSETG